MSVELPVRVEEYFGSPVQRLASCNRSCTACLWSANHRNIARVYQQSFVPHIRRIQGMRPSHLQVVVKSIKIEIAVGSSFLRTNMQRRVTGHAFHGLGKSLCSSEIFIDEKALHGGIVRQFRNLGELVGIWRIVRKGVRPIGYSEQQQKQSRFQHAYT